MKVLFIVGALMCAVAFTEFASAEFDSDTRRSRALSNQSSSFRTCIDCPTFKSGFWWCTLFQVLNQSIFKSGLPAYAEPQSRTPNFVKIGVPEQRIAQAIRSHCKLRAEIRSTRTAKPLRSIFRLCLPPLYFYHDLHLAPSSIRHYCAGRQFPPPDSTSIWGLLLITRYVQNRYVEYYRHTRV